MQAKALWYVAPGEAELRDEAVTAPTSGDVRVRALYGAVSRGTERLVCNGRVPPGEFERMLFALHPHQSVFTLPADAVLPVPDAMPPRRAVLAANMETALNAVWDGGPAPADRIAIIGGGVVGLLVARLCARLPGAEVTLIDIAHARADLAQALGANFAATKAAPIECDLVFHASGTASGLATALRCA